LHFILAVNLFIVLLCCPKTKNKQIMDSKQEDKFGSVITTNLFLTDHAAELMTNPVIGMIQGSIQTNIGDIVQADSTATRNLSGFTTAKGNKRNELNGSILTIAAAARGYHTSVVKDDTKKALVRLVKTDVEEAKDGDMMTIADRVHDVADPIKMLLLPYDVTDMMVDNLPVLANEYLQVLQRPWKEEITSEMAGVNVDKEFADNEKLLAELDDNMAVKEYTQPLLFQEYKLCRSIVDSGGNSGSEGYDVQNYTIPAGGSAIVANNVPAPGDFIYLRVVGGNSGVVISTSDDNNPGTPTYTLQASVTFKGPFGDLALDPSKTHLVVFNPGTASVVVRGGPKVNP